MPQHPFELEQRGMTIRGTTYVPAGTRRWPTVVFFHGFTGHRIEAGFMFVHLARALVERGIAAVTFDFLHSGESDGSFEQMLVSGEIDDALRVTQWVQGQPFVDRSRLGVLGFSLGGLIAAYVTGQTEVYRARALLAPTTSQNLCRLSGDGQTCPDGRPNAGPHMLHPQFFTDLRALRPEAEVVRHLVPTLLVQGTGDQAVPPAVSQVYLDAIRQAGGEVECVTIDEADHVFGKPRWRQPLIEAVGGFFARQLAGG